MWISILLGCWVAAAAADMYHGQVRYLILVALGTLVGWWIGRGGFMKAALITGAACALLAYLIFQRPMIALGAAVGGMTGAFIAKFI